MLIGHRFYGDNGATAFGDSDKTFNGTAESVEGRLSPVSGCQEQSGFSDPVSVPTKEQPKSLAKRRCSSNRLSCVSRTSVSG